MSWLDTTYDRIIAATRGGKSGAQSMLANTSFVCAQFLRDLTLRSDPTFGSFQITVLFLQEVWGLRSMRAIALHVQPPETVHKSSRPAPLPLRPELMGYSGPSYVRIAFSDGRIEVLRQHSSLSRPPKPASPTPRLLPPPSPASSRPSLLAPLKPSPMLPTSPAKRGKV